MYEILEHSADVRIRVSYNSMEDLICSLTSGFKFLLIENEKLNEKRLFIKSYEYNKESMPYRIAVHYLNQMILEFDLENAIPSDCQIEEKDNIIVIKVIFSKITDESKLINIPKAATYSSPNEKDGTLEITIDV
ncbi:archease [Cuniculiplasma sp. SKW3]|uniref:archease n=1 Tax=Cuniculiplasma sp. SKW3 TaxID=3400170 RepID=UPI003FD14DC6